MLTPENELGVIVLFAQQCEEAGFEILSIQAAFPDAVVRHEGIEYHVEFEYQSSNFYQHNHDLRKADLIICWERDRESILPILALSEPGWEKEELALPTTLEREAAYWKQRALRAERSLTRAQNEIENESIVHQPDKKSFEEFEYALINGELDADTITGEQIGEWAGKSAVTGRRWKRLATTVEQLA